jgi:protein disulfide-isomerase
VRIPSLRVLGVLAALAFVTGCGGGDEEAGKSRTTDPPVEVSPVASSSADGGAAAEGTAGTSVAAAIRAARVAGGRDGKRVLLEFGADWCEDCLALAELAQQPKVATLLKRYHVVLVDVGQFDRNMNISKRYGDVVKGGIPALVVLETDGRVVTTTRDGSFANARKMTAAQVAAYLERWDK